MSQVDVASPERTKMLEYLRTRAASLGPGELRARFRAAAAEFEATLDGLPEADARRASGEGAWSIAHVADHLAQTMIRSADELRHLLAGRRPPAPPVYDGLLSGAVTWVPWAELVDGVRAADAEFDRLLQEAAGAGPADRLTVRTILVVNRPDGEPDVFPAELTWKEYTLVQRLHLLDHRTQVRRLRAATGG
jgi:DinB superfamily